LCCLGGSTSNNCMCRVALQLCCFPLALPCPHGAPERGVGTSLTLPCPHGAPERGVSAPSCFRNKSRMHFYKGLCTGGGGFIVTWLSGFPFGMQRPWHHIPISIWWSARYHTELHGLMMVDCVDLSVLLASQQDWFVKGGGPQRMLNIRGANGCLGLQQIYAGLCCCGGIAHMQVRKDVLCALGVSGY
jgi:hypothetical protein